jgi:hypothetical protein
VARTSTTSFEIRHRPRVFSSPVALAFVRTVTARRGLSEAQACKLYLDYLNRSKPTDNRGQRRFA